MSNYYNIDGTVCEGGVMEWAKKFDYRDSRVIGKTDVGDMRVSTVFLGLDHNYNNEGPPLIFETMIFGGLLDQETWHYSTKEEAEVGHEAAVAIAKKASE